jgi:hypothetical protein
MVEPEGLVMGGFQSKRSVRQAVKRGKQAVDLRFRFTSRGADEHHVVEGRDEGAAVEEAEVHRGLDLGHVGGGGFGAGVKRAGGADELDPRADADGVPGGLVPGDGFGEALFETGGQFLHMGVVLGGHHLGERGARQANCTGLAESVVPMPEWPEGRLAFTVGIAAGDGIGHAPDGGGHAAGDAFADDEHVGLRPWVRV